MFLSMPMLGDTGTKLAFTEAAPELCSIIQSPTRTHTWSTCHDVDPGETQLTPFPWRPYSLLGREGATGGR